MSLLLEALKKAELAKQSLRPSRVEPPPQVEPIITRESLPDITQPLEILPNDLPSATAPGPAQPTIALENTTADGAIRPPLTGELAGGARAGGSMGTAAMGTRAPEGAEIDEPDALGTSQSQAAARQMFEVKEMDYNPRRPFYITIGVLLLCGAGYGGYVWWQMQPRAIYNAAAAKAAPKGGAEPAAEARPPAEAPPGAPPNATAQAPVPAAAPTIPAQVGTPAAAPASPVAQVPPPAIRAPEAKGPAIAAATPGSGAPAGVKPPAAVPSPATPPTAPRRAASAGGTSRPAIAVAPPTSTLDPQIERAYDAFQRGDLGTARDQYQRALQQDPSNRDALLGLAAIDTRTRDYELAESRYIRLLEADPRDAYAMAGLIALRGQIDPVQSESRLKTLIAAQPEAAQLHFVLGNQYAAQKRWPEAQASFFKAFTLEPENPDFAFNLAISLDQMRQIKPALEYYRRALALSATRAASFDKASASTRISELARQ